jgi:large subunit ribosomal protein L31
MGIVYHDLNFLSTPYTFPLHLDRRPTDVYTYDLTMKKDLHPNNYRPVVFQDINNGYSFLTRSTATAEDKVKWEDGNEYPLVKVHITSASHPFFTGEERILDIEGRVDKFKARAAAGQAAREQRAQAAAKQAARKQTKTGKPRSEVTADQSDN